MGFNFIIFLWAAFAIIDLDLIHTQYFCTQYCDKKIKNYCAKKIKRHVFVREKYLFIFLSQYCVQKCCVWIGPNSDLLGIWVRAAVSNTRPVRGYNTACEHQENGVLCETNINLKTFHIHWFKTQNRYMACESVWVRDPWLRVYIIRVWCTLYSQFHQHFTCAFFVQKCFAQLFSTYM